MEAKTPNQEIDLMEVLVRLTDYLRANIFLTLLLPVAGALAGWGYYQLLGNKIQAEMMVVTDLLSEQQCDFLLTQLESADTFPQLTADQRNGLVDLSHRIISEEPLSTSLDRAEKKIIHIIISVTVTERILLKPFEHSILSYLENSLPAVLKKKQLGEFYHRMISEIDEELVALEKVKSTVEGKTQAGYGNPALLYTETVSLTEKKNQLSIAS